MVFIPDPRVRGCRFGQFCEYFYRIFLTSESYLFICHGQLNTQQLFVFGNIKLESPWVPSSGAIIILLSEKT